MEKHQFVSAVATFKEALEVAAKIENPQQVQIYATTRGAVSFCDIEVQDEPVFAVWHNYYLPDEKPIFFHPEAFTDEND